jgi:hypothetical protein
VVIHLPLLFVFFLGVKCMFIVVTTAIFTGIIAAFGTRAAAPYLEIDALIARGGLAAIFTTIAGLNILDRTGNPIWSMTLAPIAGMLGLIALVTLPNATYRLFTRLRRRVDSLAVRAREMRQEYIYHRYLDRE